VTDRNADEDTFENVGRQKDRQTEMLTKTHRRTERLEDKHDH
jgi:hypothetical protein